MMARMVCLLIAGILLGAAGVARAGEPPADGDRWSTATVTRVETTPWGFFKVELPRLPTPGTVLKPEEKGERKPESVDISLIGLVTFKIYVGQTYAVIQTSVLRLPFSEILVLDDADILSTIQKTKGGKTEAKDNPFEEVAPFDQPLFCVYSQTKLAPREDLDKDHRLFKAHPLATRKRVLDTVAFTLYQGDDWAEGQFYRWELFDVPMMTTLAQEQKRDGASLQVLDSVPATVLSFERKGNKSETRVGDIPLAELFWRDRHGDKDEFHLVSLPGTDLFVCKRSSAENVKWKALHVPFFYLLGGVRWANKQTVSFCGSTLFERDERPMPALWVRQTFSDGRVCQHYLRLPFLGTIFSIWNDPAARHSGGTFIPRLTCWSGPAWIK